MAQVSQRGIDIGRREHDRMHALVAPIDTAIATRDLSLVRPVVSIDVTTEVRWFFDGPLPAEVLAWFTQDGARGLQESRRDTYRDDDLVDVGVKRRFGTTLELKERLDTPQTVLLGWAVGRLETWQRWSPADDRVDLAPDTAWVAVDKTVIKRRFDDDGVDVELTEATRAMSGQGCDAEIGEVSIGGRRCWSLAFAAFGSLNAQRRCLMKTWEEHVRGIPPQVEFGNALPYGYPEWLVAVGSWRSAAASSIA